MLGQMNQRFSADNQVRERTHNVDETKIRGTCAHSHSKKRSDEAQKRRNLLTALRDEASAAEVICTKH